MEEESQVPGGGGALALTGVAFRDYLEVPWVVTSGVIVWVTIVTTLNPMNLPGGLEFT